MCESNIEHIIFEWYTWKDKPNLDMGQIHYYGYHDTCLGCHNFENINREDFYNMYTTYCTVNDHVNVEFKERRI